MRKPSSGRPSKITPEMKAIIEAKCGRMTRQLLSSHALLLSHRFIISIQLGNIAILSPVSLNF